MQSDRGAAPNVPGDEMPLVQRLCAGDDEAFATLVRTFSGQCLAVARRLLGNDEDARDAVQDAFLSCLGAIDKFEGNARLSTWLHRIVLNAALMKLRARKRKKESSIEDLLPKYYEDGHRIDPGRGWRDTVHDELERRETRRLVREKIGLLPDPYRAVLVLRDIEQLDTETTASILGKPANAVRVQLHRARQALRTHLDPLFRSAT
jgi:RNA polymerase sigma-70 factor (ECF subfamily)